MVHDCDTVLDLVGNHGPGFAVLQQRQGFRIVAALSAADAEPKKPTIPVSKRVHIDRQSNSVALQSLVFAAPFLRPVAAF